MATVSTSRLREFAEQLAQKLAKANPSVIIATNNASYHAFRLLASEDSTTFQRYLPRLRHLNAAAYLPMNTGPSVLFTSELEYGRSLRDSLNYVPTMLRKQLQVVVLLQNDDAAVRQERARGEAFLGNGGVSESSSLPAIPPPIVCRSLTSEDFHEFLGEVREAVTHRLNRPFNVDATLAYSDLFSRYEPEVLRDGLSKLGLLVSFSHPRAVRWSLLRPRCLDRSYIESMLEPRTKLVSFFHKMRFFGLPDGQRLLLAPMCHAQLSSDLGSLTGFDATAKSPLLNVVVKVMRGQLREDITIRHKALALYDVVGFWMDVSLLRNFQEALRGAGFPSTWQLELTSLNDYYGPVLAKQFVDAIETNIGTKVVAIQSPAETESIEPGQVDSLTMGLIKTATIVHYEQVNDATKPRAFWRRAGMNFSELKTETGLTTDALSIGLDLLCDAGLTESYNRFSQSAEGGVTIDRAFNTLSDEFLNVLAFTVWRFDSMRQQGKGVAVSTAVTTLNKIFALLHYMRGLPHARIYHHRQGKTVTLDLDAEKGLSEPLSSLLQLGKEYFMVDADKQVRLTPKGNDRDWVTHLPKAREIRALVDFSADLWSEIDAKVTAARTAQVLKHGRKTFDVFSALVDCIGEKSPEWGTASIAHQLEWALQHAANRKQSKAEECLHSAEHKLRALEDAGPILTDIYRTRFQSRRLDPLAADLVTRLSVLPENSRLLGLLKRLHKYTWDAVKADRVNKDENDLRSWTNLFMPLDHSTSDPKRTLAVPPSSVDGYVCFVDLVPMKKLAEHDIPWAVKAIGQLAPRWALRFQTTGGRELVDALAVCFLDPLWALRFSAGISQHVAEMYWLLGEVTKLQIGLTAGIAKGPFDVFENNTDAQRSVTGKTLARAASLAKHVEKICVARNVWGDCLAAGLPEELGALATVLVEQDKVEIPVADAFDVLLLGGKQPLMPL